jgi:hypothetical protein
MVLKEKDSGWVGNSLPLKKPDPVFLSPELSRIQPDWAVELQLIFWIFHSLWGVVEMIKIEDSLLRISTI